MEDNDEPSPAGRRPPGPLTPEQTAQLLALFARLEEEQRYQEKARRHDQVRRNQPPV